VTFTGEYEHTIDAKNRLAIPAEIRSKLDPEIHGTSFYLALGSDGYLWLWPQKTFEALSQAVKPTLLPADEWMQYEQLMYSQATELEIDKTGRIRVPERMRTRFGLGRSIVILGVRDHLELRDAEEWEARREGQLKKLAEIMLRARQAMDSESQEG
jgi:MraZ protein